MKAIDLSKADEQIECAGCGARIYFFTADRAIAHEPPDCAWFAAQLAQVPPDVSEPAIEVKPVKGKRAADRVGPCKGCGLLVSFFRPNTFTHADPPCAFFLAELGPHTCEGPRLLEQITERQGPPTLIADPEEWRRGGVS